MIADADDLAQFNRIKLATDHAALTRQVITATGELRTLIQRSPWLHHHDGNLAQILRDAQDTVGLLEDTIPPAKPQEPANAPDQVPIP